MKLDSADSRGYRDRNQLYRCRVPSGRIGLTVEIGDYPLAAAVTVLVAIIFASGSDLIKIRLEKTYYFFHSD